MDLYAEPGSLTALMGGSGAGKTTAMDCILGRKTTGIIRGDILVNGHPKEQGPWSRVCGWVGSEWGPPPPQRDRRGSLAAGWASLLLPLALHTACPAPPPTLAHPHATVIHLLAKPPPTPNPTHTLPHPCGRYVEQSDIHSAGTTVREALAFSARLRLPEASVGAGELGAVVDDTLAVVDLTGLRDSIVGEPGGWGGGTCLGLHTCASGHLPASVHACVCVRDNRGRACRRPRAQPLAVAC